MSAIGTPEAFVYCNHCGTANPPRAAVRCNCGHVHARVVEVPHGSASTIVVEQWFRIALRIACGAALCISSVVPISGATMSAALLGAFSWR